MARETMYYDQNLTRITKEQFEALVAAREARDVPPIVPVEPQPPAIEEEV